MADLPDRPRSEKTSRRHSSVGNLPQVALALWPPDSLSCCPPAPTVSRTGEPIGVGSLSPETGIVGWWQLDWVHQARCAGEEPELFFPVGATGPALDQIRRAKAICAQCPVRAECLKWALASRQDHGIWGGMTEEERRGLRWAHRRPL